MGFALSENTIGLSPHEEFLALKSVLSDFTLALDAAKNGTLRRIRST